MDADKSVPDPKGREIHQILVELQNAQLRGDQQAFGMLFSSLIMKCEQVLLTTALHADATHRVLTFEDAQDIVQETFIHVIQKIDWYQASAGGGKNWICKICRNLAIDRLRRKGRQPTLSLEGLDEIAGPPLVCSEDDNPEQQIEKQELFESVVKALNELSMEQLTEILVKPKNRGTPRKKLTEAQEGLRQNFYRHYKHSEDLEVVHNEPAR